MVIIVGKGNLAAYMKLWKNCQNVVFIVVDPNQVEAPKKFKSCASYFFCMNSVIKMSRIILIKYLHDVVASNIQQI